MTIHLLCGVPGSGKASVASQLTAAFTVVPHDETRDRKLYAGKLLEADQTSDLPVLGDAPFAIQALLDQLHAGGAEVVTYYLTDRAAVIAKRYITRTGRLWSEQHANNLVRYDARDTWDHRGTPDEFLQRLTALKSR